MSERLERRRRAGPYLLLLPLLFGVLLVLQQLRREPRHEPGPAPDVSSPDQEVAALLAELDGGSSGWLVLRLAPLHAEPARQAFEARALRRRLGLAPGEPWRLTASWEAPDAERGGAPRPAGSLGSEGAPRGEAPPREAPAAIGLGAVEVHDAAGLALGPLPPAAPASQGDGAVHDPLVTLLRPPEGALHPGQTADWILWGRAPLEEPRLVGLVPEGDATFRSATGFAGPVALRSTSVRRADMSVPLARLERDPGKNQPASSSKAVDVRIGPDER